MMCPHCGHEESRVTETRASAEYDRRIRICRGCSKTFQTIERVAVYAGRAAGYIEAGQSPVLPEDDEPERVKVKAPERFVAHLNCTDLTGIPDEVQPLLVEWWNGSRRSKHGTKAAWTEGAWRQNVRRVAALPQWKQLLLAQAGIEHGWQALKPEYMGDVQPPADQGLAPKSSAMQEAIEQWNNRVA
jgi:hypothetical protein